jgi:hypothetical protein
MSGASTKAAQQGAKRGKGGITTVLLLLPVVAVLLPTFVVLLIGMMPTAVAAIAERRRSTHLTLTVGLLNFCGTLPGLVTLWEEEQAYATAARVATDAFFWMTAYGAAAVGWGIFLAMPLLLAGIYGTLSSHRLERLKRHQARLVREWGEEIIASGAAAGDGRPPE